jgi:DnaJ-domain-containing protein 1
LFLFFVGMLDCFQLLNEPRRPWLKTEALKERFLALSAEWHPDRFHGVGEDEKRGVNQRFAELNAAFNCLRDHKARLLHLLELESGGKPKDVQRIPPGTMDLFVEVGQHCRDVDAFLAERAKVTSPMLKVPLFEQAMVWIDKLKALQQKVNEKRDALIAELQQLNPAWETAPDLGDPTRSQTLPLVRLEQIYRILSYVGRWTDQIQERSVLLSL